MCQLTHNCFLPLSLSLLGPLELLLLEVPAVLLPLQPLVLVLLVAVIPVEMRTYCEITPSSSKFALPVDAYEEQSPIFVARAAKRRRRTR